MEMDYLNYVHAHVHLYLYAKKREMYTKMMILIA